LSLARAIWSEVVSFFAARKRHHQSARDRRDEVNSDLLISETAPGATSGLGGRDRGRGRWRLPVRCRSSGAGRDRSARRQPV